MTSFIAVLINSIWFIFPAYIANASPVIFGGGAPIDFRRNFLDGQRIFGDGKTWRGFLGGIMSGIIIGSLQGYIYPSLGLDSPVNDLTPIDYIFRASLLSFGALCGDLTGSFIKRRIKIKRGAPFPIVDQIGFLVLAFLFVTLKFETPLSYVLLLIPLTLFLHLGTNIFAYLAGLKEVWY
ncbi:MAG: CDP-2,3-bis-(O-geranylgeranyl)-sn-glycerol synthase [Candidatus Heimdallarchaeota archaeon]